MRAWRARGGLQLHNGVVIRLGFAVAQPSEETQRPHDNPDPGPEFCLLLHSGSQENGQFLKLNSSTLQKVLAAAISPTARSHGRSAPRPRSVAARLPQTGNLHPARTAARGQAESRKAIHGRLKRARIPPATLKWPPASGV